MADTRCANPAYQLDVDEMVLDYLLYKCIEAQIRDFEAGGEAREKSIRLLEIFDTMLRLFKINHPGQRLPDNMEFNIKLSVFLDRFTRRHSPADPDPSPLSGDDAAENAQDRIDEANCLRRRLALFNSVREQRDRVKSGPDHDREVHKLWRTFSPNSDVYKGTLPLILLTPSFLEISAETVNVVDHEPSAKLMDLAAEFMLRAAVETLLSASQFKLLNDILRYVPQTPRPAITPIPWELGAQPDSGAYICRAFAWGYITSGEDLQRAFAEQNGTHESDTDASFEFEELVSIMFQDWRTKHELESWRAYRNEYLSHLTFEPGPAHDPDAEVDDILREKLESRLREVDKAFPAAKFDAKVVEFVERIWGFVGSAAKQNKPVLVQIEEGYLNGLNGEEFQTFMKNIGEQEHLDFLESIVVPDRVRKPKSAVAVAEGSKVQEQIGEAVDQAGDEGQAPAQGQGSYLKAGGRTHKRRNV